VNYKIIGTASFGEKTEKGITTKHIKINAKLIDTKAGIYEVEEESILTALKDLKTTYKEWIDLAKVKVANRQDADWELSHCNAYAKQISALETRLEALRRNATT
jgi:hypothetical protein